MINKKVNLNLQNDLGNTPLHIAIYINNHLIVNELLEAGADLNMRNKEGCTPVDYALRNHRYEIAATLVEQGAKTRKKHYRMLVAYAELGEGNFNLLKILIEKGISPNDIKNIDGDTPLHMAISRNYFTVVEQFIALGANVNALNDKGNSPLHTAICCGNPEIVRMLVNNKADLNIRNKKGCTPLDYAKDYGNYKIIAMLEQAIANENALSRVGNAVNTQANVDPNTASTSINAENIATDPQVTGQTGKGLVNFDNSISITK